MMGAIAKAAKSVQEAQPAGEPVAVGLQEQFQMAEALSNSTLIPADYRGKPSNVLVAMNLGKSMGLSPAESLYRISVIKGTPSAAAELIASRVRESGHRLRVYEDEDKQSVTATINRNDDPDFTFKATRDMAWAKKMNLAGKDNYVKQPMTMLMWRAITAVAKKACPEVLFGMGQTADEIAEWDEEPVQAEAVEVEATDYMQLMRDSFNDFKAATELDDEHAMLELCRVAGVMKMSDMTDGQAKAAYEYMETYINR